MVKPFGGRPGHVRKRAGFVAPVIGVSGSCRKVVVEDQQEGVLIPGGVAHTGAGEVEVQLGAGVDVRGGRREEDHLLLLEEDSQMQDHGRTALG